MNRYLIIADDFTGANDTGVQLVRRGINTSVSLTSQGIGDDKDSHVLDTESRGLSPEAAGERIRSMLKPLKLSEFDHVIKKVDSTLRGNIAAEIKAADDTYGSELVLFMPALPDMGRTTLNGIHCLRGVPITETELAADPKNPVTDDNLTSILKGVFDEPVELIRAGQLRDGGLIPGEGRIFAADAQTNRDMREIVAAVLATGKKTLWVGSAAIADNLLGTESEMLPAVALVASVSEVSRKQVKYCEKAGVKLVIVPIYELLEGKDAGCYIERALELLRDGNDVILLTSSSYDRNEMARTDSAGEKLGMSRQEVSDKTQRIMSEIAKRVIERQEVSGLFLTGGDTAIGFFEQVNAGGSRITGEVSAGIPMMLLNGGQFDGLKVITKAGAFGNEDAIAYALRKLKEK